MAITTRQQLIFTFTILLLGLNKQASASADSIQAVLNVILFEKANNLRYENPDSSIYLMELCYANLIESGDTLKAIEALIDLANINGHQANYKASYDKLWQALFLADEAKNEEAKIPIYINLGRYYSFYKRKEEALRSFRRSLDISKRLVAKGVMDRANLVQNYYALSATFRELNEPILSQIYLDSCYMFHSPSISKINISFLKFESAFLKLQDGKYSEALKIYQEIQPWMEENSPAYQVLVYTYMGDSNMGLGNYSESEKQYKKALEISDKYHSHVDFSPLIHQKLSELYFSRGDLLQAYNSLKTFNELDEEFFDSRSENNRPLLEIQDAFREKQDRIQELLQEQKLIQLEHENSVWFLQRIILMVSLIFLLIIGIIYFNYVRSKHLAEKQLIQKEQELEIKKANELVELKNKELAASTLKLIEKDEFLSTLKDKLANEKGDLNSKEVKQIVRSIGISNAQNWEEFETRFIAVNKDFYNQLREKFPKLTQGDQKLCALIKLNFSSKDMAKLMGISVESVHTTRYRLRKKLNLSREVNLTEFIANLA